MEDQKGIRITNGIINIIMGVMLGLRGIIAFLLEFLLREGGSPSIFILFIEILTPTIIGAITFFLGMKFLIEKKWNKSYLIVSIILWLVALYYFIFR